MAYASDPTSPSANATAVQAGIPLGLVTICLRHWLLMLIVLVACGAGGIAYLLKATPLYTSTARLHVMAGRPKVLTEAEPIPSGDDLIAFLHAQRAIISSSPVLRQAVETRSLNELGSLRGASDVVRHLRERLRVSVGRRDGIVSVEYDAPVASDAAAVVNAVVDAYIAQQAAQQHGVAAGLLRILEADRSRCEGLIAEKRRQMLSLRKAAAAPSLDPRDDAGGVLRTLQGLKEAMIVARMETAAAEAAWSEAYAAYRADPEVDALIREMERSGTALSDPDSAQVRASIADLEQRIQELIRSKQCLPSHPEVRAHKTRLDYLKAGYVVGLSRKAAAAAARQQRLETAVRDQESMARDIAEKADDHARLEAELRQLERHVELVDGRIKEIEAVRAAGAINVRVIEPAVAEPRPAKPAKVQVMALALTAGLVLGASLAALREGADHRLRRVDQVRAVLNLPVLGVIPRLGRRRRRAIGQVVRLDPLSPAAEAFRAVRTATSCGCPGGPGSPRKLLVAGAAAGDGTSLVVSNLGVALAQAGWRTIVVDANMRSASQHVNLGVGNSIGLGAVLAGDVVPASAIQRTQIEGLDVLAAGPMAASPPELLAGPRLQGLLRELSGKYDCVLIDAPPAAAYADARSIAGLCDGAVLVVRLGRTDGRMAAQVRDGLLSAGAAVLGVVVNGGRRVRRSAAGCFDMPAATRRLPAEPAPDALRGATCGRPGAAVASRADDR